MFGFLRKKAPAPPPAASRAEPGRSSVVPRLRPAGFLEGLAQKGVPPDQLPVTRPFVADLVVTYAFDLPDRFQLVAPRDLARLGLEPEGLHALAVENLGRELENVGLGGSVPLEWVEAGNDLEACLLLREDFWDRLDPERPDAIVVAPIARDTLLVTTAASPEAIAHVKTVAREAHERNPAHALSGYLLAWSDGAWVVHSAI